MLYLRWRYMETHCRSQQGSNIIGGKWLPPNQYLFGPLFGRRRKCGAHIWLVSFAQTSRTKAKASFKAGLDCWCNGEFSVEENTI